MDDWVNASHTRQDHDLMLQMDIEECEWLALANMSGPLLQRCRILQERFPTELTRSKPSLQVRTLPELFPRTFKRFNPVE